MTHLAGILKTSMGTLSLVELSHHSTVKMFLHAAVIFEIEKKRNIKVWNCRINYQTYFKGITSEILQWMLVLVYFFSFQFVIKNKVNKLILDRLKFYVIFSGNFRKKGYSFSKREHYSKKVYFFKKVTLFKK